MANEGARQIERQNEIDRLKREKSKLERDIEEAKKKSKDYEKTIKEQPKISKDVERLQKKRVDEEQKRNAIEEKLNRIKPLDDLKEQKQTLERQIEEDKRVIEDENTSEARNTEREEELARLDPQIQEREKALPWRQRLKNVFKKLKWIP